MDMKTSFSRRAIVWFSPGLLLLSTDMVVCRCCKPHPEGMRRLSVEPLLMIALVWLEAYSLLHRLSTGTHVTFNH
ncbi:hypothetical protein [Marinicella sediminis]|nr:hypothetical protein [Marinicella sediminis]